MSEPGSEQPLELDGKRYMEIMSLLDGTDELSGAQIEIFRASRLTEIGQEVFDTLSDDNKRLMICLDRFSPSDRAYITNHPWPETHFLANKLSIYLNIVKK